MTDWNAIDDSKYADEDPTIQALLAACPLDAAQRAEVQGEAIALVQGARGSARRHGVVESFLQEYSLGTREGLALMCLAEALLRVPDTETRDRLFAEKIASADWACHAGRSDSLFVNASTWGLMLTGKLVDVDEGAKRDLGGFIRSLAARIGEPVIRQAVAAAVRMMGEQFVLGRTIAAALKRAAREDLLCSFDMLGEGARTAADAERYEQLYAQALTAVGKATSGARPEDGHGISVKLSALSPRFEAVQQQRVMAELYPRLLRLAELAAAHDLGFSIDAEEADRLLPSLALLDRLAHEPALRRWSGLGFVVQAYQKRAPLVIDAVGRIARDSNRRIMVRLVKGAYWDSEIKRAQIAGRPDYPVFTTKPATDLSYLVCARALLDRTPMLYPQFATHNAHTLAAVRAMAGDTAFEYQRLHGMGEALYGVAGVRPRVYAPVGGHEELLPYLVRRLLENGANSSFVHALLDDRVPAAAVARDPITQVEARPHRHPRIARPREIYGPDRVNPLGRDFSMAVDRSRARAAEPIAVPSIDLDALLADARSAQPAWNRLRGAGRAPVLRAMGDALEAAMDDLVALLAAEGGKTLNDGVAEVREAVDFCRYYAMLAERQFGAPEMLAGPVGETNWLELGGRGVFACISPWNFPLAIFTGQIAAALAAGNAVIAKPAEQTPMIATKAIRLFRQAGLDPRLVGLAPGEGSVIGAALVAHPGIDGVAFTGGTDTAWAINRTLAARPGPIIPFIAETGGLNAMFVDTSALREQVVDDVILSAFGSAGQRCSALRMLFLPEESADGLIKTLAGALDALVIGEPADPATDIGPVIDAEAKAALEAHVARLDRIVAQRSVPTEGNWFGPVIAEVPTPDFLEREVFGPILHIYRYKAGELESAARALAARGYGLTLGIHSRIEDFADRVRALVPAGNVYVNRSMIGAVVGVQPFGGEGLSGTGPKAGGPHALLRYAVERAVSVNISAQGGDPGLMNL